MNIFGLILVALIVAAICGNQGAKDLFAVIGGIMALGIGVLVLHAISEDPAWNRALTMLVGIPLLSLLAFLTVGGFYMLGYTAGRGKPSRGGGKLALVPMVLVYPIIYFVLGVSISGDRSSIAFGIAVAAVADRDRRNDRACAKRMPRMHGGFRKLVTETAATVRRLQLRRIFPRIRRD